MSFWDFGEDCALDCLKEGRNTHHILAALSDPDACITYQTRGSYVLYQREQAVLVLCDSPELTFALELVSAFCNTAPNQPSP